MTYYRPEFFAERTKEQKKRGRRIFLTLVILSILFTLVLAGLYVYASRVTYDLTVQIDHSSAPCKTRQKTVETALTEAGFRPGDLDIIEPGRNARLEDGMTIRVQQVRIVKEEIEEATDFKTVEEEDRTMKKGEKKTFREGKPGKDLVTYRVTYTSGVETDREVLSRQTLAEPVDQIIHVGVIETINGFAYTRREVFQSTAYTGGGRTVTGTHARVGEIAVDPRVIPLGTTVYVEGFGPLRAEDTGGAIKGHIIDIYMSSKSACRRWGRRNVTVYLP